MSKVVCGIRYLGIDSIAQQYADSGYQRTDFHLAKFTRMTPDTQIFIILVHSKGFPHRILKTGNWKPETGNRKLETDTRWSGGSKYEVTTVRPLSASSS